jgi:hypothetical protein
MDNDYPVGESIIKNEFFIQSYLHHYPVTDNSVDSTCHLIMKEHGILSAGPCSSLIPDLLENGHYLHLQHNRNEAALSPSCPFLWISLKQFC